MPSRKRSRAPVPAPPSHPTPHSEPPRPLPATAPAATAPPATAPSATARRVTSLVGSPAMLAARAGARGGRTPAPAAPDVGRAVTRLHTPADAEALAATLLHPDRAHPVVVVSVPSGRDEPWIDVEAIRSAVQGLADVVVLPTGATSWRLADLLPPRADVYGGAGRVYPPGAAWHSDPWRSPVRFAYGESEAGRATEALITDALGMVATSRRVASARPQHRSARGTVRGVVPPSRALVQLVDVGVATIWSELTAPGVPIERLVTEGQTVRGSYDPETRRLDVATALRPPQSLVAAYPRGAVVLCRVEAVRADVVEVAPVPGAVVAVPRERVTGNPLDRLTDLFTPGETVLARVAEPVGAGGLALRLDDVDDDEAPLPAPALLPGGPPWLVEPVHEEAEEPDAAAAAAADEVHRASAAERAAAPSRAETGRAETGRGVDAATTAPEQPRTPLEVAVGRATEGLEAQVRTFRDRARELEARVLALEAKVRNQKTALRQEKVRQRSTALRSGSPGTGVEGTARDPATSGAAAFADVGAQFRHEVYLEWVARIPAGQKAELPLAEYGVGPGFLPSLEEVEGVDRTKVVQVVVEVLTGFAEQLDGRDLHQLRVTEGGGSPPLTREGGWTAWRVALQRETPAARRLHYWRRGSEVELARVVLHDDLRM